MKSKLAKESICPLLQEECVGEECMAWRWDEIEHFETKKRKDVTKYDQVMSPPKKDGTVSVRRRETSDTEGFCVLMV